MSYQSNFLALLHEGRITGEGRYHGFYVLCSAANQESALERLPLAAETGDHSAHVVAFHQANVLYFVERMFAQDSAPVCTPPAENAAVADLPVPAVAGPGVCTTVSNGTPARSHCARQLRPSRVSILAASSIPFRTAALATKYRAVNWTSVHTRPHKTVLSAISFAAAMSSGGMRSPSLVKSQL